MLSMVEACGQPAESTIAALGSALRGLTTVEAERRLGEVGHNALPVRHVTAVGVLQRQIRNPLLILLVGAALVSGATGDLTDAIIIALIVALSVGLGFFNELRAERAASALHANIHHDTIVWRDGTRRTIDVADIVPGDIVEVSVGGIVPADLRLIEAIQLECDEAVLTGESVPALKSSEPMVTAGAALALPSCAFMGTIVHQGSGRGVVVATGSRTEFGKIAVGLNERPAETAFQAGLRSFSKLLVAVAGVLTVSIFVINVALSRPLIDALLFSLAIAIGITPQLLPAIVSVSLATGSRQLAKQRVLVKRLVTIEDLGNIELLFTDKTGTLTEGKITFDRNLDELGQTSSSALLLGLLCNESSMSPDGPVGGNSLDQALFTSPAASLLLASPDGVAAHHRTGALPFDHQRQLASVTVTGLDGTATLITKGAPEVLLARCTNPPASASASSSRRSRSLPVSTPSTCMPMSRQTLAATAPLSPVMILTAMPSRLSSRIAAPASGLGRSMKVRKPTKVRSCSSAGVGEAVAKFLVAIATTRAPLAKS